MQNKSVVHIWKATMHSITDHLRPLSIGICFFTAIISIVTFNAQTLVHLLLVQILQSIVVSGGMAIQSLDTLFALLVEQSQGKVTIESLQAIAAVQLQLQVGFAAISPLLIAITVLLGLLQYIALQFYFIVVIKKQQSTVATMWLFAKYFIPNALLALWVLVRSFAWVPFIGPMLAVAYVPRYSVASMLLIRDHKGIFTAAQQSFTRTRGYYWYIVRSTSSTVAIASIILSISIVAVRLLHIGTIIEIVILSCILQCYFAFLMVFTEQLSSQWK